MDLTLEERAQQILAIWFLLPGFVILINLINVFPASGADIPPIGNCRHVTMRDSGGWWLSINNDGSASYGLGTLPVQIRVKPQTFSFEEIYQQASNWVNQPENSASTRYLAISFYRFGESAAIEYRSVPVIAPLVKFFNRAREYSIPPEHKLDQIAHERINSFWIKSPPISP